MNDSICIGLIADTHIPGARKSLWPQVHEAFASVDYIVHAGDLHVPQLIDDLAALAPTYAVRGNGDIGVDHPQLKDTWVLDLGGLKIGVVHEFPTPILSPHQVAPTASEGHLLFRRQFLAREHQYVMLTKKRIELGPQIVVDPAYIQLFNHRPKQTRRYLMAAWDAQRAATV